MNDLLTSREIELSEAERKKHLGTIDRLTEQSGLSKTEIGKLYEAELERAMSARVRDFLPILIGRKVKQDLQGRHSG